MAVAPEARSVEFKSAGHDFWRRYHEYRRLRHKESRPDDPLRPDDVEERLLKRDSPFDIHHHHEVVEDGRLVSWLSGSTSKPGTPGHESNKHLFWADLYVRADARRRGIGSSWLPLLVELMNEHDVASLRRPRASLGWKDDHRSHCPERDRRRQRLTQS